jgi:hypothetical protein
MIRARIAGAVIVGTMLGTMSAAPAAECAPDEVLYMAIEPMRAPLNLRGEQRRQYLDRIYGAWHEDGQVQLAAVPVKNESEAIRMIVTPAAGWVLERIDVHVEVRIDYLDASNRRTELFGHRELARYPLDADVAAEIAVPRSAIHERGSVLVIVTLRGTDGAGAPTRTARALPVDPGHCPRRVYTHDRFTAIRLNRDKAKTTPAQ